MDVLEDKSGSGYRCTAALCKHDREVCYLPVRSKEPLRHPTTGVTLVGFVAVLRDQGLFGVGVIQLSSTCPPHNPFCYALARMISLHAAAQAVSGIKEPFCTTHKFCGYCGAMFF